MSSFTYVTPEGVRRRGVGGGIFTVPGYGLFVLQPRKDKPTLVWHHGTGLLARTVPNAEFVPEGTEFEYFRNWLRGRMTPEEFAEHAAVRQKSVFL